MRKIIISTHLIKNVINTGVIHPRTKIVKGLEDDEQIVDVVYNSYSREIHLYIDTTDPKTDFLEVERLYD